MWGLTSSMCRELLILTLVWYNGALVWFCLYISQRLLVLAHFPTDLAFCTLPLDMHPLDPYVIWSGLLLLLSVATDVLGDTPAPTWFYIMACSGSAKHTGK